MKIEDFWNQAFLSALSRVPAEEAKKEADLATKLCVEHWQANIQTWAPERRIKLQDLDVAAVPRCWPSEEALRARADREANSCAQA